jgi:hypothetical protein
MKRNIRIVGIIISILLGLQVEAVFYFVFGINPLYVPLPAVIILWIVNTILIGCVVDEVFRKKYNVRIYKRPRIIY